MKQYQDIENQTKPNQKKSYKIKPNSACGLRHDFAEAGINY